MKSLQLPTAPARERNQPKPADESNGLIWMKWTLGRRPRGSFFALEVSCLSRVTKLYINAVCFCCFFVHTGFLFCNKKLLL